jgi:hypothetical protein
MSKPFTTSFSSSISSTSIDIETFISGVSTSPTPNTSSSYARYQKIGSIVQIEFKYVFLTTGTTGAMSINLPYPINSNYPKPLSVAHSRYVSGTGEVFIGHYNENTASSINVVFSTTYGGVPVSYTNLSPKSGLTAGDIISGLIIYETG